MNPSSSRRWSAGKSDPGLTTNVLPLICSMRSATPTPCLGSSASVFSTRRSSVPFISSACLPMAAHYTTFGLRYRISISVPDARIAGPRLSGRTPGSDRRYNLDMRGAIGLAIVGLGGALLAQEPQTPRFRIAVDAVRIDAVVTDSHGAIVTDLTAAD